MRYLKMLSLLAIAVAGVTTSVADTATATTVTSPTGTSFTGVLEASSEGGIYMTGPWSGIKCEEVQVKGTVKTHGASVTAEVPLSTLHFKSCQYQVTVVNSGEVVFHSSSPGEATVTWKSGIVDMHTSVGRCRFASGTGIHLGVLTASHKTGGKATWDLNNAKIPVTEGSFFCGSSGEWEGSVQVASPSLLYVD